jgi:hypothetical protein
MNKLEAINELMNGNADAIKKGASVYILHDDDIINKRSKKPIDAKGMLEDGWEAIVEPKWYDNASQESPVLCWVEKTMNTALVVGRKDDGRYETISGILVGEAEPIPYDDVVRFIIDAPKKRTRKTSKESEGGVSDLSEVFVGTMPGDIDDRTLVKDGEPESGNEECQTETSENTASQKGETTSVSVKGTPALVAQNKGHFVSLGLPEEYWSEFWMLNNFDSMSIVEAIKKGDEYCKGLIAEYISRRQAVDSEEIPF